MNPEIKQLWLEALRSGEYKQGKGQLRFEDKFCCMGVLCNLHAQAHPKLAAKEKHHELYLGVGGTLPDEVMLWAGLRQDDPSVKYRGRVEYISTLNDIKELSFKKIANVIERNL